MRVIITLLLFLFPFSLSYACLVIPVTTDMEKNNLEAAFSNSDVAFIGRVEEVYYPRPQSNEEEWVDFEKLIRPQLLLVYVLESFKGKGKVYFVEYSGDPNCGGDYIELDMEYFFLAKEKGSNISSAIFLTRDFKDQVAHVKTLTK